MFIEFIQKTWLGSSTAVGSNMHDLPRQKPRGSATDRVSYELPDRIPINSEQREETIGYSTALRSCNENRRLNRFDVR